MKFLNNFEELADKEFRLFLKIDDSDNVKQGDKDYRIAKFYVSDKLGRPGWWDEDIVEEVYLGEYSDTKYLLFLKELEADEASFDGTDMNVLKKYAIRLKYTLEEYEEQHGEPMKDENGRAIIVPVAG